MSSQDFVGTNLRKKFAGYGIYDGKVTEADGDKWLVVWSDKTEEKMTTKQVETAAAMFAAKDSNEKATATPTKTTAGKRAAAVAGNEKRKIVEVLSEEVRTPCPSFPLAHEDRPAASDSHICLPEFPTTSLSHILPTVAAQEQELEPDTESEEEAPKKKQKKKTTAAKPKKAPAGKKAKAQAPVIYERQDKFANGVHVSHKNFTDPKMHGDIMEFDPEDGQYRINFNREGDGEKEPPLLIWIGPDMLIIED